jgi:ABC-type sugar transport system ATPase subunit
MALREVTLGVGGEVVAVLGPSGAGKTTLLRLIAGLTRPCAGTIRLDGTDITAWPARERRVAMMFESYALYPHLTVLENCAFALGPGSGLTAPGARERIVEMAELLEIDHLLGRYPGMLSGGQRQRVALGRVLVRDAAAVCLDEPIAHLDAKLRHTLRGELRRVLAARERPVVWSTPDGLEALAVADRLVVLSRGEVLQEGRPEEVYGRPADVTVARLLGDPPMNLLPCRLRREGDRVVLAAAGFTLPLPGDLASRLHGQAAPEVVAGLRPTAITVQRHAPAGNGGPGGGGDGTIVASVYVHEPLGKYGILTVRIGTDTAKVKLSGHTPYTSGETVWLRVNPAGIHVFDARTGQVL